jgi:hypothetical protein
MSKVIKHKRNTNESKIETNHDKNEKWTKKETKKPKKG